MLRVILIIRERKRADLEGDKIITAKKWKMGDFDKGRFLLFSRAPQSLDS